MPHDALEAGPGKVEPEKASKITARVTTLSVAVASTLVAAKLAAWLLSGSVAMLASLADSALDLAASLTTFFAVRYAATPADDEHRFGHGKAEAFASLLQAQLVVLSAGYLIYESVRRFLDPRPIQQGELAIGVMILSIVLTLGLIWAQQRALNQTSSVAVEGDRAHYAADLGANAAVIAGLVFAGLMGVERADPIVGFLVALWLLKTAWDVGRNALNMLMDRELSDADRATIVRIAGDDARVLGVHQLRTRAAGPFVHIQLHMDLDPDLSLTDAHAVVVAAEERLMEAWPAADILIHPDPRGRAEPHGHPMFEGEGDKTPEHGADDRGGDEAGADKSA